MEYTDLVSVIIPVYNVKKYLKRCVNSVLGQSYKNLEIILIDDGSLDGCGEICDEYAKRDDRIRVIHKENGGLSDARNTGLAVCRGMYLTFIDGDDYVSEAFVQRLYEKLKMNNADVSVCTEEYVTIDENGRSQKLKRPFKNIGEDRLMNSFDTLECALRQRLFDFSACIKLYKSEIFKEIRFPVGFFCEDQGTIYKAFLKSSRIIFFPDRLYFYVQRQGSILHDVSSAKRYWDGIQMIEKQREGILAVYPELLKAVNCRCLSMYFHAWLGAEKVSDGKLEAYAWGKITQYRTGVMFDRKGRFKTRAAAFLSLLGKKVLLIIDKMINR